MSLVPHAARGETGVKSGYASPQRCPRIQKKIARRCDEFSATHPPSGKQCWESGELAREQVEEKAKNEDRDPDKQAKGRKERTERKREGRDTACDRSCPTQESPPRFYLWPARAAPPERGRPKAAAWSRSSLGTAVRGAAPADGGLRAALPLPLLS